MKIDFDPDGVGQDNGNYFGMPFTAEDSRVVLLSVPWDVTASYGVGSRFAPDAIIGASIQLDFYDPLAPGAWRKGIGTIGIDYSIQEVSEFLRDDAVKVMKHLENGGSVDDDYVRRRTDKINDASREINRKVFTETLKWLSAGKGVGLVGGDHSTPLGLMQAVGETRGKFSVLHIDAHADLRESYEGFEFSHASIMNNAVTRVDAIDKLVQVGIRDMSEGEAEFAAQHPRIRQFTDRDLSFGGFNGKTWDKQCEEILSELGPQVYVSFDIDGLTPGNAPNTGTPVPGGLTYNQAVYLMEKVVLSGRKVAAFDLCEVSPKVGNDWDANVGARLIFKMCNLILKNDD